MKKKFKFTAAGCIVLLFNLPGLYGQNGTLSSGGLAFGAGGVMNYSIGQTDYKTLSSANTIITQGLQQTYEVIDISGLTENQYANTVFLYPNPVSDFIHLKIQNTDLSNLHVTLINSIGQEVLDQSIQEVHTILPMLELTQGIYFLKITSNNTLIKTFKLIKTK
jgi:hypothetical protein